MQKPLNWQVQLYISHCLLSIDTEGNISMTEYKLFNTQYNVRRSSGNSTDSHSHEEFDCWLVSRGGLLMTNLIAWGNCWSVSWHSEVYCWSFWMLVHVPNLSNKLSTVNINDCIQIWWDYILWLEQLNSSQNAMPLFQY